MDNLIITTEKEFDILEIIEKNSNITQRELSQRTGLSLGLINIIIKKLVRKGYIKIKKMNKRRILYSLTPKAIMDKTNRTYNYITKSINLVIEIKNKLGEYFFERGIFDRYEKFIIIGNNEISEVVKWVLSENNKHIFYEFDENNNENFFVINCNDKKIFHRENILNIVEIL